MWKGRNMNEYSAISHYFNVGIAVEYGINEAILLQSIYEWVKMNEVRNEHFHDGRCWDCNSIDAPRPALPVLHQAPDTVHVEEAQGARPHPRRELQQATLRPDEVVCAHRQGICAVRASPTRVAIRYNEPEKPARKGLPCTRRT